MEPVGQLDEDDAEIARHGEEHLPEVLGLLRLGTVEVEPADLGHAVDERRNVAAERALHVSQALVGVLHHVVEDGGLDQGFVRARAEKLRQDGRDRHGMADVGLPAQPDLGAVRLGSKLVGRADGIGIDGAARPAERLEERSQGLVGDLSHG